MLRASRFHLSAASAAVAVFDTHCHLGLKKDYPPPIFERAVKQNVRGMTIVGIDYESSVKSKSVAEQLAALPCSDNVLVNWSAGLHPHHAHDHDLQFPQIENLVIKELDSQKQNEKNNAKLVAIGESGLDFFKSTNMYGSTVANQEKSFDKHLELAKETGLPIIIHCRDTRGSRDAHNAMFGIVERHPGVTGVVHCFSAGPAEMERAVKLGLFVSFPCTLGYATADELRAACKATPIESITCETDAPWLPPTILKQQRRNAKNEPAFVNVALDLVVEQKLQTNEFRGKNFQEARQEIGEKIWANSMKLFRLPM